MINAYIMLVQIAEFRYLLIESAVVAFNVALASIIYPRTERPLCVSRLRASGESE